MQESRDLPHYIIDMNTIGTTEWSLLAARTAETRLIKDCNAQTFQKDKYTYLLTEIKSGAILKLRETYSKRSIRRLISLIKVLDKREYSQM